MIHVGVSEQGVYGITAPPIYSYNFDRENMENED